MIAFDRNFADFEEDHDTALMVRASQGDQAAFNDLVERNFASAVRIIAAMLGHDARAEDLAQEVFIRVYRSRERYIATAKFSTFLGTVIRNAVLNEKRRLSRQRVSFAHFVDGGVSDEPTSDSVSAPAYEVDLISHLDRQQTESSVRAAIAELPGRQRRAIELVHFHGMTYVKAAEEMKTSRMAVKSLLGRGRQSLGDALSDHYESRFDVAANAR